MFVIKNYPLCSFCLDAKEPKNQDLSKLTLVQTVERSEFGSKLSLTDLYIFGVCIVMLYYKIS